MRASLLAIQCIGDVLSMSVTGVGAQRRKWYIHIKCNNEPHCSGQDVCIDRGCEDSSVLAAGVSEAADVGFIYGVQE